MVLSIFKKAFEWLSGGSRPPEGETPEAAQARLAKAWRRTALVGCAVCFLLGAATRGCGPSYRKELEEKTKELKSTKESELAQVKQVESLKQVVQAYERRTHTKRTQVGYLDGAGNPVRNSTGEPVLLETVEVMASEGGSTSSLESRRETDELRTKLAQSDLLNLSLKRQLEERRGGTRVFAGYGTSGTKHAGIVTGGTFAPMVHVNQLPGGAFELVASGSLDLSSLGL